MASAKTGSAEDLAAAARRGQILSAAETVFSTFGYASSTMDAVAAEAGLSKGSLYNYFKGKQELFREVVVRAVAEDVDEAEDAAAKDLSARQKMEWMLDLWFRRRSQYERIGRLVLEFWASAAHEHRSGKLTDVIGDMYGRWRDVLTEIVAEGIAAGEFREGVRPSIAASLVMAAVDGTNVQSILDMGIEVDEEFLASMKRAVLTALIAEPIEGQSGSGEE